MAVVGIKFSLNTVEDSVPDNGGIRVTSSVHFLVTTRKQLFSLENESTIHMIAVQNIIFSQGQHGHICDTGEES